MIHNALYWLEEFHLDGLRLDAVHAIIDDSPRHLLEELAERVRGELPRGAPRPSGARERRQPGALAGAHGRRASARGTTRNGTTTCTTGCTWRPPARRNGYYGDYHGDVAQARPRAGRGLRLPGRAVRVQGRRAARRAQRPSAADRVRDASSRTTTRSATAPSATGSPPSRRPKRCAPSPPSTCSRPAVPMLFMGEEWGTRSRSRSSATSAPSSPRPCADGRREEFAGFPEFSDPASRERIPDPTAEEHLRARPSCPGPSWGSEPHAAWLAWYRRVLALRRERIVPLMPRIGGGAGSFEVIGPTALAVAWRLDGGRSLTVLANLSAEPVDGFALPRGDVSGARAADGWRGSARARRLGSRLARWQSRTRPRPARRAHGHRACLSAAPTGGTVRTPRRDQAGAARGHGRRGAGRGGRRGQRWRRSRLPDRRAACRRSLVVRADRLPARRGADACRAGSGEVRWTLAEEAGAEHDGDGRVRAALACERRARARGRRIETPLAAAARRRCRAGYHRLRVEAGASVAEMALIVVAAALLPAGGDRRRRAVLGHRRPALHGCAPRRTGAWAISATCRPWWPSPASRGADVIGLNPLHALFLDRPEHASPYSPASRLFLNPLYIDVTALPELMACQPALRADRIAGVPGAPGAAARRRAGRLRSRGRAQAAAARAAPRRFPAARPRPSVTRAFAAFRARAGRAAGALLPVPGAARALRGARTRPGRTGRPGPRSCGDPGSPDGASGFAAEHRERIDVSGLAAMDRRHAARPRPQPRARERGMAVGLYRDLAVGADAAGAETWANPRCGRRGRPGRRPARCLQSGRPGLGPAAVPPAGAARGGLPQLHRAAPRQHAPCRRAADRPCHGAAAPLLDSRPDARPTRAPTSPTRSTTCWASWRWRASATAASSSARIWAPCRRASASAWPRPAC